MLIMGCLDVDKKPCGKMHKIVHGAAGLFKAAVGIDAAEQAVVDARTKLCLDCPHNVAPVMGRLSGIAGLRQCDICSCLIKAKVLLASEKCPEGKW